MNALANIASLADRASQPGVVAHDAGDARRRVLIKSASDKVADDRGFEGNLDHRDGHYRTPMRFRTISNEIGTPRSQRTTFFIRPLHRVESVKRNGL
jgi:hypothetical protein